MSDHVKGAKKQKKGGNGFALGNSFTLGKYSVDIELVIAILMAVVYAALQLASAVTGGKTAMILTELMFLIFLVLAYLARKDVIKGLKRFEWIAYIFLGLSIVSLLWQLLISYIITDTGSFGGASWALLVGLFNAIISVAIIAALVYIESTPLEKINVKVGDSKGILLGVAGIVLCLLLAVIGSYLIFGGMSLTVERFLELVAVVIVFGLVSGAYEELWFRGLLLSKITPILGESPGNIFQAAVFGVFEAMIFAALTGTAGDMTFVAILIIGAMM
ncbi:MAG TPA: CPBP family glutamic-type intramembrane protease, partial [Methanocellaceae archaeon]